jgi:hypothetical protein
MCLSIHRASLCKERLGYIPKKGKAAFVPHKTSFVKNNGRFCTSCKQVGHLEQKCLNKKSQANVSSVKLNSFYVLTKGANGVKVSHPFLRTKIGCIKDSCAPQEIVAHIS